MSQICKGAILKRNKMKPFQYVEYSSVNIEDII